MKTLRGALIGCGFFARNHMHGWKEVEGVEMVAVCDAEATRAEAFARDFGGTPYTLLDVMVHSEELDFVDVATTPASHRALVEQVAEYGLPVICQKPMAPTLEDAHAMVAACEAADVPFMVHENFRWQTPMRAVKEAAAKIGPLFWGRVSFRTPYDVYRDQPYLAEDPRFILADLGVHVLDLARFFLGEAESLTCHTNRVNPRIKGEDTAAVLLKMENGAACLVDCSYASQTEEDLFPQTLVTLEGADGTVVLGPHYVLTTTVRGKTERRSAAPNTYPWSRAPFEAVQQSVFAIQQHWADCLRSDRAPETSGRDNLGTLELVFGAYQSAETGLPYTTE